MTNNHIQNNMSNESEIDFNTLKHKLYFFVMPTTLTFFAPPKNESKEFGDLRKISPYFYWFSGHEFFDLDKEHKYLIQYQTYYIQNGEMHSDDVHQKWCASKGEMRDGIIKFLDMWDEHKRIVINSDAFLSIRGSGKEKGLKLSEFNTSESAEKKPITLFSDFPEFIGNCIMHMKSAYDLESEVGGFDCLQKIFWRDLASKYVDIFTNPSKVIPKKVSRKPSRKKTINNE